MAVRVLIAGAGIAGLTAALSLHAAGIEALIVESALELKPMGAGINLLPHAVGELTELGLGGELEAAGIATSEQAHFDRHGNLIWSEPRGRGQDGEAASHSMASRPAPQGVPATGGRKRRGSMNGCPGDRFMRRCCPPSSDGDGVTVGPEASDP
jgi:hypothetical protein